jgi:hypothetical protein
VGEHVVAEVVCAVVADDLRQTDLVVDDQEGGVVLLESVPCVDRGGHGQEEAGLEGLDETHFDG